MDYSHGISYTPANVRSSAADPPTLQSLESLNVSYVHIYWVDLANTRRCRIVPIEYFVALMNHSKRPGVNIAKVGVGLVYLMTPEGFSGIGEYLYRLDRSTMRVLRGVGFGDVLGIMGRFEEKAAGPNGVEVGLCPRTVLGKIVDFFLNFNREAKSVYATEFLVGFESEFILLKSTNPVVPSNVHQWSATSGLLVGSLEAKVMHDIAEALKASGIPPLMLHAEAAPGQYEVVSGPLTPLDAADALIYTRDIIVHTAAKHGLHATFAPRPFMTSAGSSAHAHVSVHSATKLGTKTGSQLSAREQEFLAGLLDHLPAVAAFTLPTPASYKRVADGVWSGGTYVSYGNENREAPVRLTNAASPSSRNFELRFIDGTANPHLALAAVLAAGMIGIKTRQALTAKDCQDASAAAMTEEERKAMGITKRMPLSVEEARRNLRADNVLRGVLGKELVGPFLAVNETLGEALTAGKTEDEQLTSLVEFY
ncbi:glutamine synthetase guanido kinase [Gautieria morchelliformis]|nr:glutamine synthetase guanido kinase [Gautieria morchelliformis]